MAHGFTQKHGELRLWTNLVGFSALQTTAGFINAVFLSQLHHSP
jgi:hypothetical protein